MDWWSSPDWDAEDFEARLKRARQSSRAQYLRLKGLALVSTEDEEFRAVGKELLLRVVRDYQEDRLQSPMAHFDLAQAYETEGADDLAATHYELTVRGEDELGSLVTGADLRLAELIIRCGWSASYDEADRLLAHAEGRRLTLRSESWRFCVARARLAAALGREDAASYATRALELLAEVGPQFSRHPTVGLIETDEATVEEMRRLARDGAS